MKDASGNQQNKAFNKYLTPNKSPTRNVSLFQKRGRNRVVNSALISEQKTVLMYQYYAFEYEFQDDLPDTNTIFWDSNLRKFRTRSCARSQNEFSLSKSIDILYKNNNYRDYNKYNRNSYTSNRNKGEIPKKFSENKFDRSKTDKNNYYHNIYNNNYNKKVKGLSNSSAVYPQNRKTNNYNQQLDNRNKQISLSQNQQNQTLKSVQNSQFQNNIASPFSSTGIITGQINVQNNNNESTENNISVVKKFKERTIALLPGQTIEPQTKDEAFDNPIEIIIENPDGTKTSLIKQTKITTIKKNFPIEENKVQSLEGASNLALVKQLINYEYKTVTKLKEQIYNNNENNTRGQDGKAITSQNRNYINNNLGNELCSCEEQGNYSYNNNNDGNYDNNFTGDKKDNEKSWNNQNNINGDLNQKHDTNLNNNKLDNIYDNNEVNMNNKNLDKQNIGNQKDGKYSNNNKYGDTQEGRNIISGKLDGKAGEDQLNDNQNSDMLEMAKTKNKSIEQSISTNDKSKSLKKGINSNMGIKEETHDEGKLNQRMTGQKANREENEGNKLIKDENERKYENLNSEENEDLENKNLSKKKILKKINMEKI